MVIASPIVISKESKKIRQHAVVFKALVYQLVMVTVALWWVMSALFFAFGGVGQMRDVMEQFPDEGEIDRETFHILYICPLFAGTISLILLSILMYQSFKLGVSFRTGTIVCSTIFTLSFIMSGWSLFGTVDLMKFPNDMVGIAWPSINSYVYMLHYGFSHPNKTYNQKRNIQQVMDKINDRLKCCGVFELHDYYSENVLTVYKTNYEHVHFTLSREWITECSTQLNSTCVVPSFCCKGEPKERCNAVEVDTAVDVNAARCNFWTTPCAVAIYRLYRNQFLVTTTTSLLNLICSIVYFIQLYLWRKKFNNSATSSVNM